MERIRHAAPLLLVALGALVLFERLLPGHAWLAEQLGPDVVLRFALGLTCLFVAILLAERRHMGDVFDKLAAQLRLLREAGLTTGGGARTPAQREHAIEVLLESLASKDAATRDTARRNLARIVGKDLGDDPEVWRRALS